MRLLYTITAYPPSTGGAQVHLHELVKNFATTDVEVVSHWDENRSDWLLGTTLRAPAHERRYRLDGVQVDRLAVPLIDRLKAVPAVAGYYAATRWAAPRLAAPIRRRIAPSVQRADIVHCVRVGREPLALASADAARDAGRPFVFTPLHHPGWGGYRHRVYLDLYRRADRVVALTEAEKLTLIGLGVRPEAIAVTGIGPVLAPTADGAGFRARHGIEGNIVLFLGQHFRYKGFIALLDAAPAVWRRFPDTTFLFAGPSIGRSDDVFRSVDRRVRRLGAVDLQTKSDALAACDVLCVPSTQESFGGVFTEAWSFGRPVIGGDIPPVREVIEDGKDGFVVAQTPTTIADRVIHLLGHPVEAREMGALGRSKVAADYSWAALAAKTEKIYESLA